MLPYLETKRQIDENLQRASHLDRKQHFNVLLRFVRDEHVQRHDYRYGEQCGGHIRTQVHDKVGEDLHIVVQLILAEFVAERLKQGHRERQQDEDWQEDLERMEDC